MLGVKLIKAEGLRRILVALFFIAYTFTVVYSIRQTANTEDMTLYLLLILVPFGIWLEVVRYMYIKANDTLNEACNPSACLKLNMFVRKADILQQYKALAPFQEGFATLDLNCPDEVEQLLKKRIGDPAGTRNRLSFECSYLLFSVAAAKKDKNQLQAYFQSLEKIFSMRKRISPDVQSLQSTVLAKYLALNGECEKALEVFKSVNAEALKPRERAYYYYYLSETFAAAAKPKEAAEAYAAARELAPQIALIAENPL